MKDVAPIGNGYTGPPQVFICQISDPIDTSFSTICIERDDLHKYCDGWSKSGDECTCPCHKEDDS
jgi:hypothetical protein